MERVTISIPEELLQRLRLMASERLTSIASLVGDALKGKAESYRPRPRSIGIGASRQTDTLETSIHAAATLFVV